ncbi:MAG: hypothetical protein AAF587_33370 [Bacteroidota bacterium]
MKSSLLIVLFVLIGIPSLLAQPYQQGQLTISPGVVLGNLGLYSGGSGIPLMASAEYGLHEYFGVGPFVGVARYSYNYIGSRYRWNFVNFGGRGDFHYLPLLEELLEKDLPTEKLDLYLAAMLGFRIANFSSNDGFTGGINTFGNGVFLSTAVGARYYFTDNIAVFGELGYILFGVLNAGVTIKIK